LPTTSRRTGIWFPVRSGFPFFACLS
jgi:hypothetical protein